MLRYSSILLSLLLTQPQASFAADLPDLSVTVTSGPKECDDAEKVTAGSHLKMHYVGTIDQSSATGTKGEKFDSSRDRDATFDVQIGVGQVIQGWDQGIVGLCKGATATLVIPPHLGYGESGAGGAIPGGATLNFEVEVVDIMDGPPPQPNLFEELDTNTDGKLQKSEIEAFFAKQGQPMPDELWEHEDKDKDGFISWEEFGGPKGTEPPTAAAAGGDEL